MATRLRRAKGTWMQIYLPELSRVIRDNDFKSIVTPRYNCVGFAIGDPNWWDHVGEEITLEFT
jgi:hypothetical protein